MGWLFFFSLASIASFIVSYFATKFLVSYLRKRNVMDNPNARSNHKNPTPRGGGIAIIGTIVLLYLSAAAHHHYILTLYYPAILCPFILAIISFMDDIKPIAARWRFLIQIIVVALAIHVFFADKLVFQGLLPQWLDNLVIGFFWLWFINLYNFMDGIDGLSGSQTISISAGVILISIFSDYELTYAFFANIIAFATLGFLVWNWHPAKIFMGDVGSIPLGFLLGWLLLDMAADGYYISALILPLYYLADSTITITKRLFQGKKIWQPHSEHFYQQAVRSGMKHNSVVLRITLTNLLLLLLALSSALLNEGYWLFSLPMSIALVIGLLLKLAGKNTYAL